MVSTWSAHGQHMVSTRPARMNRWSDSTMASAHGQCMVSTRSAAGVRRQGRLRGSVRVGTACMPLLTPPTTLRREPCDWLLSFKQADDLQQQVCCCAPACPRSPCRHRGHRGRPGLCDVPLVRKTLSVLTTFPIFDAIRMRNHRIIKGNVAEGAVTAVALPPGTSHTPIS